MKIKRILSLILCALMCISLFCACTTEEEVETPYPEVILTDKNGNEYTEEVFSYYIHYLHDMMESSFASSVYYYYLGGDFGAYLDSYYDEEQTTTLSQYLINYAKDQYVSFVAIENKYAELNLQFDDDTLELIESYKEYIDEKVGDELINKLCEEIGISYDDIMNLLIYHSYKQIGLTNYYCGEGGSDEIKQEDIQKYYNQNYMRFRYIVLSKLDSSGTKLGESDLALLAQQANETLEKAKTTDDFAALIKEVSDSYYTDEEMVAKIKNYKETYDLTDEEEEEYLETLKESNEMQLTKGMICDLDGIYDMSYYNSTGYTLDADIVSALKEMEVGDVQKVETDSYIWILRKEDKNESEEYVNDKTSEIRTQISTDIMNEYVTFWKELGKYTFNDSVVAKYVPKEMEMLSWAKSTTTSDGE